MPVDKKEYAHLVNQVSDLLKGKTKHLIEELKEKVKKEKGCERQSYQTSHCSTLFRDVVLECVAY